MVEEVNLSFNFGDSCMDLDYGFGPTMDIKGMKDHPKTIKTKKYPRDQIRGLEDDPSYL
jgi:hypothetical protein